LAQNAKPHVPKRSETRQREEYHVAVSQEWAYRWRFGCRARFIRRPISQGNKGQDANADRNDPEYVIDTLPPE
jgi:hypothetical protein